MDAFKVGNLIEDRTGCRAAVTTAGGGNHFVRIYRGQPLAYIGEVLVHQTDHGTRLDVDVPGDAVTEPMPVDEALIYLRLRLSV